MISGFSRQSRPAARREGLTGLQRQKGEGGVVRKGLLRRRRGWGRDGKGVRKGSFKKWLRKDAREMVKE